MFNVGVVVRERRAKRLRVVFAFNATPVCDLHVDPAYTGIRDPQKQQQQQQRVGEGAMDDLDHT
jgi:hypothetical protein